MKRDKSPLTTEEVAGLYELVKAVERGDRSPFDLPPYHRIIATIQSRDDKITALRKALIHAKGSFPGVPTAVQALIKRLESILEDPE